MHDAGEMQDFFLEEVFHSPAKKEELIRKWLWLCLTFAKQFRSIMLLGPISSDDRYVQVAIILLCTWTRTLFKIVDNVSCTCCGTFN